MDSAHSKILVNGYPTNHIFAFDRGLSYGHGLFETIRFACGEPLLWEAHLTRMKLGCERLAIPWQLEWNTKLPEEAQRLCGKTNAIVKIVVTSGTGGRGYRPPKYPEPLRIVSAHPLPSYPKSNSDEGIRVCTCHHRLSDQPQLAGIKHLNRLDQVLASAEWQGSTYQEGIMLDQSGHVVEGTRTNLFGVQLGCLITPSINRCGISGVMRDYLLSLAVQKKISVKEGVFGLDEFQQLPELFVCNSVLGIWPIRSWERKNYQVGDITRSLQGSVQELLGA